MTTATTTHPRRSQTSTTVILLTLLIALTTITGPAALATETGVRDADSAPAAVVGNTAAVTPTTTGDIGVFGYDNTTASTVATTTTAEFVLL
jgi:hypothetical protein